MKAFINPMTQMQIAGKTAGRAEYIESLEKMIFITSHKVRKPVCNFLGLLQALDDDNLPQARLKTICLYLKSSAAELEQTTSELTDFISKTASRYKSA